MAAVYTARNKLPATATITSGAPVTVTQDRSRSHTSCQHCGAGLRTVGKYRDVIILACRRCGHTTTAPRLPAAGAG